MISQGKLRSDCGDLRFTALYPYEGTNYTEGLILDLHFDKDVKDYSGLDNNGNLISGTFTKFIFNYGLENGTVILPNINVSQFTITLWLKAYNNTGEPPKDWWDANWKYRIPINISNGNSFDIFNYPSKIILDTLSLYSQGKIKQDLSDIRVIEKIPSYIVNIYNPNNYNLNDYQIKINVLNFDGEQAYFSENQNYIEVLDSPTLDIQNNLTICAWINTSANSDERIVGKPDAYIFGVVYAGNLYFNYYNGTDWVAYSYSNSKVNDGKLHFVCVTYSSGTVKFYIDGRLDNIVTVTNATIANSNYNLYIGGMPLWNSWYFNGTIDEVRIYNKVLSSEEILNCFAGDCPKDSLVLYHPYDGNANDYSGNGNDGTINNVVFIKPGIKGLIWKGNFSIYNPLTKKYLNYCFEQPNGECNEIYGKYIWVKVDYLPANSNITLYLIPSDKIEAVNGDEVFDFYDDFNDNILDWNCLNGGGTGTCFIQDGKLILYAPDYNNRAQANKQFLCNSSVGCLLETLTWSNQSSDGNLLGFSDGTIWSASRDEPLNGYYFAHSRYLNSTSAIEKIVNTQTTILASISDYYLLNKKYLLGIAWKNNNLYVFKDKILILNATDSTFTTFSYIFVSADSGYWLYDWIRVRKYADLEPTYNISFGYVQIEIPFVFETSQGFNNTNIPSTNTTIWAKVKYLPANQNTTIYVYYGNPNALSENYTCKDIFLFCDEFNNYNPIWSWPSDWIIENGKLKQNYSSDWPPSGPIETLGLPDINISNKYIVIETYAINLGTAAAYDMLIKTLINNTWYQSPNVAVGAYDTWFGSLLSDWGEPDERQWHLYKVKIKQGYQEFYMDDKLIKTNNYAFSNPIFQELALSSKGQSYWEWIAVYLDYDNILTSYGSEESLIPQKYPVISKESSFGIKIYENSIYGFVNTTNGYKEISAKINLNQLYFIALVYDGYYLKLYINESLANYTYIQGNVLQNSNNLLIDFKGIIDELRIYNISLSEDRILEEFNIKLEREIPYYTETGTCNTQNTIVYVKLPYLINETIYMYYCNENALSKSNGTEVFDFYDNFTYLRFDWYPYKTYPWTTWSGVNPTGWTANNGTLIHIMSVSDAHQLAIYNISFGNDIYETAINLGTLESIEEAGIAWNVHTDGSLYYVRAIYYPLSGRVGWELIKESPGGVSALAANYTGLTGNTWYYLRILYKNGYIYTYVSQDLVNWSLVLSAIDATPLPPGYFGLHSGFSLGVSHMYRWIRIRKYIEPWPSYSFGAEETC